MARTHISASRSRKLHGALVPWAPDREAHAWRLDVDEEHLAVGAVCGPGELHSLVALEAVPGEVEDLAFLVQAAQVLFTAAVLAQDETAAGTDGDVVRSVEKVDGRRFEEQDELPGVAATGPVLPDLAQALVAATGGVEEDAAAVGPAALEPGEGRGTLLPALGEHAGLGGDVRVRVVDGHPLDGHRLTDPVADTVVGLELRLALDRQHLQDAAAPEILRVPRDEPIEAGGVSVVLGLVDDAVGRIHRDRFVDEPAHGLQRRGVVDDTVEGGHLEDVAVVHGESVVPPVRGLLAGQPGPGGSEPTGAVHRGAVDADIALGEALFARIEGQRGRAPARSEERLG